MYDLEKNIWENQKKGATDTPYCILSMPPDEGKLLWIVKLRSADDNIRRRINLNLQCHWLNVQARTPSQHSQAAVQHH